MVEETDAPGLDVRVYPNPVDHVLNVDMAGATGKHELMLHDATGRIVLQAPVTKAHTQLDLNGYSTGNYILRVLGTDAQTLRTFKIIINH